MNKSYQVWAMTIGAALTLVQPQAVWALEPTEVNAIAEEITVRISGGGSNGTGVIIAKKRNTYYVLTAHHVVRRQNVYEIETPDDREYAVDYSTVRRLPGVDLALLEFTSRTKYRVAAIGDSERLTAGSTVYIAGWPAPGATIQERIYQFTEGKISGRRSSSVEGYTLIYTNVTRKGMSGGPVLNDRGQVIAIHGKAEGDSLSEGTGGPVLIKAGFNLGIPIQTFIDSSYGEGLRIGQRNVNYKLPSISQYASRTPNPAIGQGAVRQRRTIYTPTNDNRFPPHIVLEDRSQAVVTDDIDRINLVLAHENLQPANCNETGLRVDLTMGPYKVCADPTNEYPSGSYEFPFTPKVASSETPMIHDRIPENGTGTGRIVMGTRPRISESYSLREHIVLTDPSWQVGPNDIERIDSVLIHEYLQPAACNHNFPLVRLTMGPYEACAYPTDEYPAGFYEFPFIQ